MKKDSKFAKQCRVFGNLAVLADWPVRTTPKLPLMPISAFLGMGSSDRMVTRKPGHFNKWFEVYELRGNLSELPRTWNSHFLMVVSIGWFQIFTWKMVVSPKHPWNNCCLEFQVVNLPHISRWVNFQEMFRTSWSSTQEIWKSPWGWWCPYWALPKGRWPENTAAKLPFRLVNYHQTQWLLKCFSICWTFILSFLMMTSILRFRFICQQKSPFFFGRFSMNPSPPQYASGLMDPQTTKDIVLVLVVMIESSGATPPCRLELKSLPIRCNGLGLGDPNV